MIKLYYWPTPNGHKITIFLKEAGLPFELAPVNISTGEQFQADFLRLSPNNKMPAIVDSEPQGQRQPLALFESGAILEYLADKTGQFLPPLGTSGRYDVLQWLYWQMAGLGPMAGQNHHFSNYAPEKIPYAIARYQNETNRLYKVLDNNLAQRPYVGGESYSVADMASYPWIVMHEAQGQRLSDFPHVQRWFSLMAARPAVAAAYELAKTVNHAKEMSAEAKKILFGQSAATLAGR